MSFWTGFSTGLASSIDRGLQSAMERRQDELSSAKKFWMQREATKREKYEAKKEKTDEEALAGYRSLLEGFNGDATKAKAAFDSLAESGGGVAGVTSYLTKARERADQLGSYDISLDFKDFKEGDTAYTSGEAGLLMPEYKGTQFKAATYGVGTSKIDEFFGRDGDDTDTARLEKQMNVGFDAKPATAPAASIGSFGSVDRSRLAAAETYAREKTVEKQQDAKVEREVTAFDTNQKRVKALTQQIADQEARAKRNELSEKEQKIYDRNRDAVKDLQTQSQLIQDAEAHVKNMESTDLSIEEKKLAIAKEKKFPAFKSYENMAVFASNALATKDFKPGYTEQDYKDLYIAGMAGVKKIANAEDTKAAGGVSFSKPNRQTILNNEIKRTLEPVGLVEDIEGKITFKIAGNKPLYFESMTRALNNVTAQTKDLEDPMMDALIKSQKDSLKADIKAFKNAATAKSTTKQQAGSSAFIAGLKPGDVIKYTNAQGKIITRLWTGRDYL
jgi:hypothetical protein